MELASAKGFLKNNCKDWTDDLKKSNFYRDEKFYHFKNPGD